MTDSMLARPVCPSILVKDMEVNGVRVNEIVEIFETLGYECNVGAELTGESGARHPFDIVAKKGAEVVVVDLMIFRSSILDTPASDFEIHEQLSKSAIYMRIKSWDCRPSDRVIVHLSSYLCNDGQELTEHDPVRTFLSEYDIKLISSANMQQAAKKLESIFCEVEVT